METSPVALAPEEVVEEPNDTRLPATAPKEISDGEPGEKA
jgi:hypothetical protein